jgi:hypothetical protein
MRTGPHATRLGIATAKQKASAKSEDGDPRNGRNEKPKLGVFFDALWRSAKQDRKKTNEKGYEEITRKLRVFPKAMVSHRASSKRRDSAGCSD